MEITKSKIIKAPIQVVWEVISDLPLTGQLTPACEKIEVIGSQTRGVGTQTLWHSTVHPDEPSLEEIIDWQPLESYSWEGMAGETPMVIGTIMLSPTPQGHTILTLVEDFLLIDVDLLANEREMENELNAVADYIENKK